MKVRDLITMDMDIDVYDDYDERLGIAYCYGYRLTKEGEKHFAKALDMEIKIHNTAVFQAATVHCDTGKEASIAKEFFDSLAGFCPADEFDKWFEWID